MSSFPSVALTQEQVKIRFEEPFLAVAINRRFLPMPAGIYRGFTVVTSGSDKIVELHPGLEGDSIAVFEVDNGYSVQVRVEGIVELDFTGHASYPVYIVAEADFVPDATTTGTIKSVSVPGANQCIICKISDAGAGLSASVTPPGDQTSPDAIGARGFMPAGSVALLPSAGQKQALAGTVGTPSSSNKYVTESDPRISGATQTRSFLISIFSEVSGGLGDPDVGSAGDFATLDFPPAVDREVGWQAVIPSEFLARMGDEVEIFPVYTISQAPNSNDFVRLDLIGTIDGTSITTSPDDVFVESLEPGDIVIGPALRTFTPSTANRDSVMGFSFRRLGGADSYDGDFQLVGLLVTYIAVAQGNVQSIPILNFDTVLGLDAPVPGLIGSLQTLDYLADVDRVSKFVVHAPSHIESGSDISLLLRYAMSTADPVGRVVLRLEGSINNVTPTGIQDIVIDPVDTANVVATSGIIYTILGISPDDLVSMTLTRLPGNVNDDHTGSLRMLSVIPRFQST